MAKQKKQSLINKVRTRIAPSPTGYPHVGTAFQALLDWVYARRYQGQFLLRIEDTDQERLVQDAEAVFYQALDWLDLTPDESPRQGGDHGPYRQSERLDIYQKYAQQLVEQGAAYYCFCSQERLAQVRDRQKKQGKPPMYDQHCRHLDPDEVEQRLAAGESAVIRLKVPSDEVIKVHDELRGTIEFQSQVVDDQVLLKSDGFPTYHLAVVVDDHLMNITHVVRGEEWLPSAPKHILLYQYFDWSIPKLIHTPTLRSEQGKKLSKREGNTDVWWYREQGFLPQALLNFLGLLVWKPNEQTEQFSKEDMAELFEWREMQVTGPVFDINKLRWLNGKYLRQLSLPEFLEQLETWMQWVTNRGQEQAGPDANPQVQAAVKQLKQWQVQDQKQFTAAIELAKDRARTLSELKDLIAFYFTDQLSYDREDLLQGHSAPEMMPLLKTINQRLQELEAYTSENWEQVIRSTADELGFSHKDAFMSLRSAVTARKHTPPLFAVMQVLGPEASHQRVVQAIAFLQNKA